LPSNFDLCNAEGGDQQCIDWQTNNNGYFVVYECITDWEVPSGNLNVQYYKGSTAQSFGLTKVTAVGKTALKGWRMSGSRFVNCSSGDLNAGCNGYSFRSGSLPTQFARGFYALATNSIGDSWSFYGATSCSNYFKGPNFAPIAVPDTVTGAGNYVTCVGSQLFFTGLSEFCSTSGFTGPATLDITGPGGFTETINSSAVGLTPITLAGDYTIKANTPNTLAQCLDCGKAVCITVTQAEIDNCAIPLPVTLVDFKAFSSETTVELNWKTLSEQNSAYFILQRSQNGEAFTTIDTIFAAGESAQTISYQSIDHSPLSNVSYYRLVQVDQNGTTRTSNSISVDRTASFPSISPNPSSGVFYLSFLPKDASYELSDLDGKILQSGTLNSTILDLSQQANGIYYFTLQLPGKTVHHRLVKE
ncbi:MAG: T9SS type A sorting domain-containing protein, partial [Fluviicola sp.]|nr:T9SS type A sorting domain-containing protein [Fluviicola sp.]